MEIREKKYGFIIKMVLLTFAASGLLYVFVLVYSLGIKTPITLGESLSYFGAVLTAVVTIFGVMWQIEKNNERLDEEKNVVRIEREQNIFKYFFYVLDRNIKKYAHISNLKEMNVDVIKQKLIEFKKHKREQEMKWFYEISNEIIDSNLDVILKLNNSVEFLEIAQKINSFNIFVKENFCKLDISEEIRKFRNNSIKMITLDKNENNWFLEVIINELSLISLIIFDYIHKEELIQTLSSITKQNIFVMTSLKTRNTAMTKIGAKEDLLEIYENVIELRKKIDREYIDIPVLELYKENIYFIAEFIAQSCDYIDFSLIENEDVETLSNRLTQEMDSLYSFMEEIPLLKKEIEKIFVEIQKLI